MKKELNPWYLALVHFSIAGLAMPFLFFLVYSLFAPYITVTVLEPVMWFFEEVIYLAALWVGVRYAAKEIAKRFVVTDVPTLARNASIYLAVLIGGSLFFDLLTAASDVVSFALNSILLVVEVGLFYYLTKRYVKASS